MVSKITLMDVDAMDACCTPVTTEGLSELDASILAEGFKALADPARLRLLSLVANAEGGEACACDLIEPLERSQPTVSHHLSILVAAGLLTREKRGRWAWYRLVPERLTALRAALSS
ncbi:MAG: metalloregulator ArsR/SmtB family transcription factor [Actinomycetota bacterium]|nr:metalloregulator ArsR/SmtB family transcription factor [Actinomycetota bacterium]